MTQRLDYRTTDPNALKGMLEIEKYVTGSNLKRDLLELVKLRASQINGCICCIGMHTKEALETGEYEQRLNALEEWRKTTIFSEREKAALAWTEALTLISENEISDTLYKTVRGFFSEEQLIALTMDIIAINGWNRLAKSFSTVPESYDSSQKESPNKRSEACT
ncbi:MAG TPA: carboxymuconolactone decarboxylase family protein [Pricia sp.]|nr:carboxymuconolactone decarboxylase family protein [Pricia sp.]